MGGCCPGLVEETLTVIGTWGFGGDPPECDPDTATVSEETLTFTRDVLCGGALVPSGKGYWRGPAPFQTIPPAAVPLDLVVWCDGESGASSFKGALVNRATGCEDTPLPAALFHTQTCDPLDLAFSGVSLGTFCIEGFQRTLVFEISG